MLFQAVCKSELMGFQKYGTIVYANINQLEKDNFPNVLWISNRKSRKYYLLSGRSKLYKSFSVRFKRAVDFKAP